MRPNLKMVELGESVDVTIIYNGRERAVSVSRRDRFLLEVARVPNMPNLEPEEFWAARKTAEHGSCLYSDVLAANVKVHPLKFAVELYDADGT